MFSSDKSTSIMNKPCSQSSFETSCSDDDDNEILTNDLCMHRSITFRGRYMFATMLVLILGAFGTTTFQQYAADSQKSNIMRSSDASISSFTSLELTDDGKVTWTTRPSPPAGSLLDPVIEAFRQGMTIDAASIAIHAPRASSDCSCYNTTIKSPDPCCGRFYIRGHKMGIQLVSLLFPTFHFDNRYLPLNAKHYVDSDLRVAVVLRNVYESIVSGYLYHRQGRECYTDPNGLPLRDKATHQPKIGNTDFVKYTTFLNDTTLAAFSSSNQTIIAGNLCQFIMDEPVERGMRAYIDFVFRGDYYKSSLLAWRALSQHIDWIGDLTHVACYEDLMTNRTETLHELLHFYYPSGVPPAMAAKVGSKLASRSNVTYSGPHATNHDADLRASLVNVVKALDSEFYHGQIAYEDSMTPCGK